MINRTYIIKNNKTLVYITYAIVLAFIVFNYETVFHSLHYILSISTPFFIAVVIAFLLNIPMKKIEYIYKKKIKKKGICRGLSIATTLILVTLFIILFFSFIIPKLAESIALIITNIFNYTNRLVYLVNHILSKMNINYAINYDSIQQALNHLDLNHFLSQSGNLLSSASLQLLIQSFGLFSIVINAITSFIMSIYLLANKETHIRQIKKIITFIFGYKKSLIIFDIATEANYYFNGFVSGQLLEACIITCLMYVGFRITHLPFPELIAFIIGIVSIIPMFGCYVGFIVGFILVLAVQSSQVFIFTICFMIIQQFEANVIYPKVVGNAVGISGLYVLLSLVIFGNILGFFGLLIAVPSMALIYAVGSRIINISLYRQNIEVTTNSIKKINPEDF